MYLLRNVENSRDGRAIDYKPSSASICPASGGFTTCQPWRHRRCPQGRQVGQGEISVRTSSAAGLRKFDGIVRIGLNSGQDLVFVIANVFPERCSKRNHHENNGDYAPKAGAEVVELEQTASLWYLPLALCFLTLLLTARGRHWAVVLGRCVLPVLAMAPAVRDKVTVSRLSAVGRGLQSDSLAFLSFSPRGGSAVWTRTGSERSSRGGSTDTGGGGGVGAKVGLGIQWVAGLSHSSTGQVHRGFNRYGGLVVRELTFTRHSSMDFDRVIYTFCWFGYLLSGFRMFTGVQGWFTWK